MENIGKRVSGFFTRQNSRIRRRSTSTAATPSSLHSHSQQSQQEREASTSSFPFLNSHPFPSASSSDNAYYRSGRNRPSTGQASQRRRGGRNRNNSLTIVAVPLEEKAIMRAKRKKSKMHLKSKASAATASATTVTVSYTVTVESPARSHFEGSEFEFFDDIRQPSELGSPLIGLGPASPKSASGREPRDENEENLSVVPASAPATKLAFLRGRSTSPSPIGSTAVTPASNTNATAVTNTDGASGDPGAFLAHAKSKSTSHLDRLVQAFKAQSSTYEPNFDVHSSGSISIPTPSPLTPLSSLPPTIHTNDDLDVLSPTPEIPEQGHSQFAWMKITPGVSSIHSTPTSHASHRASALPHPDSPSIMIPISQAQMNDESDHPDSNGSEVESGSESDPSSFASRRLSSSCRPPHLASPPPQKSSIDSPIDSEFDMDIRFPSGLGPRRQEVLLKRSRSLGMLLEPEPERMSDPEEEDYSDVKKVTNQIRQNDRVEGGWGSASQVRCSIKNLNLKTELSNPAFGRSTSEWSAVSSSSATSGRDSLSSNGGKRRKRSLKFLGSPLKIPGSISGFGASSVLPSVGISSISVGESGEKSFTGRKKNTSATPVPILVSINPSAVPSGMVSASRSSISRPVESRPPYPTPKTSISPNHTQKESQSQNYNEKRTSQYLTLPTPLSPHFPSSPTQGAAIPSPAFSISDFPNPPSHLDYNQEIRRDNNFEYLCDTLMENSLGVDVGIAHDMGRGGDAKSDKTTNVGVIEGTRVPEEAVAKEVLNQPYENLRDHPIERGKIVDGISHDRHVDAIKEEKEIRSSKPALGKAPTLPKINLMVDLEETMGFFAPLPQDALNRIVLSLMGPQLDTPTPSSLHDLHSLTVLARLNRTFERLVRPFLYKDVVFSLSEVEPSSSDVGSEQVANLKVERDLRRRLVQFLHSFAPSYTFSPLSMPEEGSGLEGRTKSLLLSGTAQFRKVRKRATERARVIKSLTIEIDPDFDPDMYTSNVGIAQSRRSPTPLSSPSKSHSFRDQDQSQWIVPLLSNLLTHTNNLVHLSVPYLRLGVKEVLFPSPLSLEMNTSMTDLGEEDLWYSVWNSKLRSLRIGFNGRASCSTGSYVENPFSSPESLIGRWLSCATSLEEIILPNFGRSVTFFPLEDVEESGPQACLRALRTMTGHPLFVSSVLVRLTQNERTQEDALESVRFVPAHSSAWVMALPMLLSLCSSSGIALPVQKQNAVKRAQSSPGANVSVGPNAESSTATKSGILSSIQELHVGMYNSIPINLTRSTRPNRSPVSNCSPSYISSPPPSIRSSRMSPSIVTSNNSTRYVNGHRRSHSDSTPRTPLSPSFPPESVRSGVGTHAPVQVQNQADLESVSARKILEGLANVGAGGGWGSVKVFTLEFADSAVRKGECVDGLQKRTVSEKLSSSIQGVLRHMPSLQVVKVRRTQEDIPPSSNRPRCGSYINSPPSPSSEEYLKSFSYAYPSGLPLSPTTASSFNSNPPPSSFPAKFSAPASPLASAFPSNSQIPNIPKTFHAPQTPLSTLTPSTLQMRDWVAACSSLDFAVIILERSPGGWKGVLQESLPFSSSSTSTSSSALPAKQQKRNPNSQSSPSKSKSKLKSTLQNDIPTVSTEAAEVYVVRRSRKVKERAYAPPPILNGSSSDKPSAGILGASDASDPSLRRGHNISAGFSVRRIDIFNPS